MRETDGDRGTEETDMCTDPNIHKEEPATHTRRASFDDSTNLCETESEGDGGREKGEGESGRECVTEWEEGERELSGVGERM